MISLASAFAYPPLSTSSQRDRCFPTMFNRIRPWYYRDTLLNCHFSDTWAPDLPYFFPMSVTSLPVINSMWRLPQGPQRGENFLRDTVRVAKTACHLLRLGLPCPCRYGTALGLQQWALYLFPWYLPNVGGSNGKLQWLYLSTFLKSSSHATLPSVVLYPLDRSTQLKCTIKST